MQANFNISNEDLRIIIQQNLLSKKEYDLSNNNDVINVSTMIDVIVTYLKILMENEYDYFIQISGKYGVVGLRYFFFDPDITSDYFDINTVNKIENILAFVNNFSTIQDTKPVSFVINQHLHEAFAKHFDNCDKIKECISTILCKDIVGVICSYMLM